MKSADGRWRRSIAQPASSVATKSRVEPLDAPMLRDVSSVSPSVRDDEDRRDAGNLDLDCIGPEDGEFELLDCPSWKKQGGRGTDYFPTSFRARYRPAMVKQRAAHVSQVTYAWVEEWVQFAFVVFLAFVVMVEQGPNRAMHRAKAQAKVVPRPSSHAQGE